MKNMLNEGAHKELAEHLKEFYRPICSERFLVIHLDADNNAITLPVGWPPTEEEAYHLLRFVAGSTLTERFTIK